MSSNRIWKFELEVITRQTIQMPALSEVLALQIQHGQPCIWVRVDLNEEDEDCMIWTFATGEPVPESVGTYIGTYQIYDGREVYHVFKGI